MLIFTHCCTQTEDENMMDETELFAQGWRRCAVGQRSTQWCAQAEEQRRRDEELLQKALRALKNIRRISSIDSAMNQNPFTLVALLAEIHYISDVVLRADAAIDQARGNAGQEVGNG